MSVGLSEDTWRGAIRCVSGATFPGCASPFPNGTVSRVGDSVVLRTGRFLVYELEIVLAESPDDWTVRLYTRHTNIDGSQYLSCFTYASGSELMVTGVLRVNTTDVSNLDAFRARLEATTTFGAEVAEFSIEW